MQAFRPMSARARDAFRTGFESCKRRRWLDRDGTQGAPYRGMAGKKPYRARRLPGEARTISNTVEQSGDTQGLPQVPEADSQSVAQLAEEGQSMEAAAVQGVENAADADVSEVKTRQAPEDD